MFIKKISNIEGIIYYKILKILLHITDFFLETFKAHYSMCSAYYLIKKHFAHSPYIGLLCGPQVGAAAGRDA